MTSRDREELLVFLTEAELYEGRVSDAVEKAKKYGRGAVEGTKKHAGKVADASKKAAKFVKSGAKAEGLGTAARKTLASRGMKGRGGAQFRKEALKSLRKSGGRTAAVYGGAAALAGGGALAARAAYRRRKAKKDKED